MNKIKRVKNSNYTTISNISLRDKELSLKAKGLLAIIMSLPDDWDFSIEGISKILPEGKTAIYSAITELINRGYCSVEKVRSDKGTYVGNDYTFTEEPYMENLNVDNPYVENKSQINTNINKVNIEEVKTNEKEKEKLNKKEKDKVEFEAQWQAYERKGSKKLSLEQWDKLSQQDIDLIKIHIVRFVECRERQYRPDFQRYIKNREFENIVFDKKGNTIFDPIMFTDKENYYPNNMNFNDKFKMYIYLDYIYDLDKIIDGYTDDSRPSSALFYSHGYVYEWNVETKSWSKTDYFTYSKNFRKNRQNLDKQKSKYLCISLKMSNINEKRQKLRKSKRNAHAKQ